MNIMNSRKCEAIRIVQLVFWRREKKGEGEKAGYGGWR